MNRLKLFSGLQYPILPFLGAVCIAAWLTIPGGMMLFQEAREAALRSYIWSVCSSVQEFQQQHGFLPQSLAEIDKSMLDYDLQIPLQELEYEIGDTGFRVSYRMSNGKTVTGP